MEDQLKERVRQDAFAELVELAIQRDDFVTTQVPVKRYCSPTTAPITLGGGRLENDAIIYNDRAFFEMAQRGEKGVDIGLSMFGFGGSLGFTSDKSLLDTIRNAIKKKGTTSLETVCQSEMVHLRGFVHLIDENLQAGVMNQYLIESEGKAWYPAIITASPRQSRARHQPVDSGVPLSPRFQARATGLALPAPVVSDFRRGYTASHAEKVRSGDDRLLCVDPCHWLPQTGRAPGSRRAPPRAPRRRWRRSPLPRTGRNAAGWRHWWRSAPAPATGPWWRNTCLGRAGS